MIHSIIKEMKLDEKIYRPGIVQARISNAKNHLLSPTRYAADKEVYESDRAVKMPMIREIYAHYWERCRLANVMDFDDLLVYTYILFRDFPEILARYQDQFRYVLVDEYQDTNKVQDEIVRQLMQNLNENKNTYKMRDETVLPRRICVVGDDAQSIYSFRGADIDNILSFTKKYSNAKVFDWTSGKEREFKLEKNYRSRKTIVDAANSLIEKNRQQIPKKVVSAKEDKGEPIDVFEAYSDVEEGEIVVNKIIELRRKNDCEYNDFAILYRTNAQSRIFEEALRKRGIPYKIYGGLSFYQRKEIKDVISYFRLVVNPDDEEAFKRTINYPTRGIGKTTIDKIIDVSANNGVSLWTVLCNPFIYGLDVNKGTYAKMQGFRELIESFIADDINKNAYEIGLDIIRRSGIMNEVCQDNSSEGLSRKENIEEFVNGINAFCISKQEEGNADVSLVDFLSEVTLYTGQDSDKADDEEKVTLMTIHSAKGLEFKNVFVVGLEENLFPSIMVIDSQRALEEERRLLYVAITRAEERCFLSYAKSRYRYGKMEFGSPSRFLHDIDEKYLRLPYQMKIPCSVDEGAGRFRREIEGGFTRSASPSRASFGSSSSEQRARPKAQIIAPSVPRNLKKVSAVSGSSSAQSAASNAASVTGVRAGQMIEHERFGLGEVMKVEGTGDNAKATIHFKNAGDKQLLLRFARFKVIK